MASRSATGWSRGSTPSPSSAISSGGDFIYTQIAFATLDTAIEFLELEPRRSERFSSSHLMIQAMRTSVASRVELAAPGVQMITGEDFAQETRDRILSNILPILIVVLIVAFVVGLAVAGLTIYTATVEKSREYGILKAEGFTNPYLYRVVFEQSMVTGILGLFSWARALPSCWRHSRRILSRSSSSGCAGRTSSGSPAPHCSWRSSPPTFRFAA